MAARLQPEPAGRASVTRAVAQFVVAGLVAVAVFVAAALLVLRELGEREAIEDARDLAVLAGRGIVEPALSDELLASDRRALERVDRVVQERVLGERVVRIKIWSRDGRIVYSDEPRLIGTSYPLSEDDREALETGEAHAEVSDLSEPENRFERGQGSLYEVYTRVRTPNGTPLLFETYQRLSSVVASGRDIWRPFAVPLLASLVLLWLFQVPLAVRLARRLRRSQAEREALLVAAVHASAHERRRIAADLHDGVVQDLAGLSYSLSAAGDRARREAPELAGTLGDAAGGVRDAIRQLRSLLVELHPPNLRAAGLEAALRDLVAPLAARGVRADVDVTDDVRVDAETEQLLYRAAAEAVRNVERHAEAGEVAVRVSRDGGHVRLEVVDDGVGFSAHERDRRRAQGHVGLALLEERVAERGGTFAVRSQPGRGTAVVLEVPS